MLARVISQTLNVRSGPYVGNNIIGSLDKGQVVAMTGSAVDAPRWAVIEFNGKEAFVARRFLAQSVDQATLHLDEDTEHLVTKVIWSATEKYDRVTYRLGCKAKSEGNDRLIFSGTDVDGEPCSGSTVDCSGWVQGLFQLIADNVNAAYGSQIFVAKDVNRLFTHSDGQIFNVGNATKQICSGTDIDTIELRSALIFGLNNGDYDWEEQDRVFEIDHIVMGVSAPDGFYITQSSSSGGGVNRAPWKSWRDANASRFNDFRVHCVDLLATGTWVKSRQPGWVAPLEPDQDPFAAAAG